MRHNSIFAPTAYPQKEYAIGSTSFRMITLPGKEGFWMGSAEEDEAARDSEKPRHQRDIAPFALAEFPVTQQLWQEVVARARVQGLLDEQALPLNPAYFTGNNRPVENVNWREAREFCRVLNLLLDKPKDFFRLPSEAEWEYAARAGTRETLYAGSSQLAEVAWNSDNSNQETVPVGLLSPNNFGLYDLSGNVFEWCEDDWHDNYKNHPPNSAAWVDDPDPAKRAVRRVRRGGSWFNYAWYCRCADRYFSRPDFRGRYFGFRLASPV